MIPIIRYIIDLVIFSDCSDGKCYIGIHGPGNKPPKDLLAKWGRLAMTEGLGSLNPTPVLPDFHLVYRADIMYDNPLDETETDENSPSFLSEKYLEATAHFRSENRATRKKVIRTLKSSE